MSKSGKDNPVDEFAERTTYHIVVNRCTDDELRRFVDGVVSNQIFTSAHIHPNEGSSMVGMVFMPVMLGMFRDHTAKEMEEIQANLGVFWEYLDKAGPRSINGYPIFSSVRLMHKLDWQRALVAIKAEEERRKKIELPPA